MDPFDEFLKATGLEPTNEPPFGLNERVYRRPAPRANITYALPDDPGVKVELEPAGHDRQGRQRYAYRLLLDGKLLFEGDDFTPSPMRKTPNAIALDLLSFLTLRPGDTDPEYFLKYSEEQLAWAKSGRCEQAQCEVSALEEQSKA